MDHAQKNNAVISSHITYYLYIHFNRTTLNFVNSKKVSESSKTCTHNPWMNHGQSRDLQPLCCPLCVVPNSKFGTTPNLLFTRLYKQIFKFFIFEETIEKPIPITKKERLLTPLITDRLFL